MRKNKLSIGFIVAALAIFASGCSDQAQDKLGSAGKDVNNAAGKTGDAVVTDAVVTGAVVKEAAEETGEAVKEVGDNIGRETDEATTTLAIKAAIGAAKDLHVDDLVIDVKGKTVTLGGKAVAKDKERAGSLAKSTLGPGYSVTNNIGVK